MIKKNFFMSSMTATMQGRPLVRFNTVIGLEHGRNVTAKILELIQESGAQMMQGQEVQFDNLVLDNIFWLGEMTDAEFMAGTNVVEQLGLAQPQQSENVQAEEAAEASPPEPTNDDRV